MTKRIFCLLTAAVSIAWGPRAANASTLATRADTVNHASASAASDDPSEREISEYKLDMPRMRRWAQAMKNLSDAAATDSSVSAALSMDDKTLGRSIADLTANPAAAAAIRRAGSTPKEVVWTMAAWLQAGLTLGAMDANPKATFPAGQNPQNVTFLRAHKAELDALAKEVRGAH